MSILVVGLSHHTAPVRLLEQVALDERGVTTLLRAAMAADVVTEAVVVSTCNRLEIYADVTAYDGGVTQLSELIAASSGVPLETLSPHLSVHREDRAVTHLFALACGLESMALGEAQILGQLRTALRIAQAEGTAGRAMNDLVQQALRVGKRAHAETGIDRAAPSLVTAGLQIARRELGGLDGASAVVVGAGSMGALAGAHLARTGSELVFVNRTASHAERLAARYEGRAATFIQLPAAVATADVLVCCTGAVGTVLDAATVAAARESHERPLVVIDLALPHDVEPEVGTLPGVRLVGLEQLAELSTGEPDPRTARDLDDVRGIVAHEVERYLSGLRAERVAPIIVALRARAGVVVDTELARLDARVPELDPAARSELAMAMRRAVDALLHAPTVRMKELAAGKGGDQYAAALSRLFDLDLDPDADSDVDPGREPDIDLEAALSALDADLIAVEAVVRAELGRAYQGGAA